MGAGAAASAAKTLQSHVVRLRNDLGRGRSGTPLFTDGRGYRLVVNDGECDALRFVGMAEPLVGGRNGAAADELVRRCDEALALWRGDAYEDVLDAPFAVTERVRLTELRECLLDVRADLCLNLGQSSALVPALRARVAATPYRERVWEQLALALYRSGRQSEGLDAIREARDVLAADLGVDPGPGLQRLRERILRHDPDLEEPTCRPLPAVDGDRCPYRGLSGYTAEDAALFVGRDRTLSDLIGRLADRPVVVITGASGSGKSSLVRAGLVPALRAGALPGSPAWRTVVTDVRGLPAPETVDLVVVDQAEELFTALSSDAAVNAAGRLVEIMEAGGRVVLVLRADFYGRLAELPSLRPHAQVATVLVGPLRTEEVRAVVTVPAQRAGLQPDPEVVADVLDDVEGHPAALPMLSVALVRAWENREGRRITRQAYRRGGGVARALEQAAEEAFSSLDAAAQLAARQLLVRLAVKDGVVWARRALPLSAADDLGADGRRALAALAGARLVTVGASRVEIVHDALLERWPRLRGWLEERAASWALAEHLDAAALAWDRGGRQDSDLYRGARLQAALDWREQHPEDVTPLQDAFLDAAAAAAESEVAAQRARADREAAGRRRQRRITVLLAAVLVVAATAAAVALRERGTADREALSADAGKMAAESLAAPDLRTSLLLAAAAYRLQPSAATRSGLLSAIERFGAPQYRMEVDNEPRWLGVSVDGRALWAADDLRNVVRLDAVTRVKVGSFPERADHVVAMSRDSRLLLAEGPQTFFDTGGTTRALILDATSGDIRRILPVSAFTIGPAGAFTGNGRWLAVIEPRAAAVNAPSDTLAIFDMYRLTAPPRLLRFSSPLLAVAGARDRLAVRTATGSVQVLDPGSGQVLVKETRPGLRVSAGQLSDGALFAVSPDGGHVAVLDGNSVHLLDTRSLSGGATEEETPETGVTALAFSSAGDLLAVGTQSGETDVLRTTDGALVSRETGNTGAIAGLAWSGSSVQNEVVYAAGRDREVVAYDVRRASPMLRFTGPPEEATGYLDYTGRYVVGTQPDEGMGSETALRLWVADPRTGASRSYPLHMRARDEFAGMSVDRRNRLLVFSVLHSARSFTCRLYALATGRLISQFDPRTAVDPHYTFSCLLNPDGRTAVASVGQHALATFALPFGRRLRTVNVRVGGPAASRLWVVPMAFAPDGNVLAWGFDVGRTKPLPLPGPKTMYLPHTSEPPTRQEFEVVDPVTGADRGHVLLGPTDSYGHPAWSPDGRRLALGTDGALTLLDAATMHPTTLRAQAGTGLVDDVAFSPDGKTVLVAGPDGEFTLWDASTGRPLGPPIHVGTGPVYAWFDPQGDVFGYREDLPTKTQRRFTFPARAAEWLATACSIAGGDLTPNEWARYVGDRPYQRTCA